MRRSSRIAIILGLAVGGHTVSAHAQTLAQGGRVTISVSAGLQPTSTTSTGTATNSVYLEDAVTTTAYEVESAPIFESGVAIRLAEKFGVGAVVSSLTKSKDTAVSATVPHPFFFSSPRTVAGTADLERKEVATHVQALFAVYTGARLDVTVSGGPSIFKVTQDVVSNITFEEEYPYDSATFGSAVSAATSKTGVGFNLGADVTVRVANRVGVGGLVRYSRASIDLGTGGASTLEVDAGGVQIAGGIRVFF